MDLAQLLPTVFQVVAIIAAGVLTWLLKILAAKFRVSVSADQAAYIRQIAQEGVFRAEEWAAAKLKIQPNLKLSGDKFTIAVDHLLQRIPGMDDKAAEAAIHAALGALPGMGASETKGGT